MMKKIMIGFGLFCLFFSFNSFSQAIQMATNHIIEMDNAAYSATMKTLGYCKAVFKSEDEKSVVDKKEALQRDAQEKSEVINGLSPFNQQTRLKNSYVAYMRGIVSFHVNLKGYSVDGIGDYKTGKAQKRKIILIAELKKLKKKALLLNKEVARDRKSVV